MFVSTGVDFPPSTGIVIISYPFFCMFTLAFLSRSCTTLHTGHFHSFTEGQTLIDVTAVAAKLAGRIEAWDLYEQNPMFDAFLFKPCKERGERCVAYRLRQFMVKHHSLCIEILYAYCNVVLVDNIRCRLLNGVVPLVFYRQPTSLRAGFFVFLNSVTR